MSTKTREERVGERFIFADIFLWTWFPVFIVQSEGLFPPLFFTGSSVLIAGISLFLFLFLFQRDSLVFPRAAFFPAGMGMLCITLLAFPLMVFAGQKTSAGNIALLGQTQTLFTFLFFGLLGLEKITKKRIFGALLLGIGSTIILLKEFSGGFHSWDMLIVFATIFLPLGNFFQKKALHHMSSLAYVMYRSLIGGGLILAASFFLEEGSLLSALSLKGVLILFVNGVLVFGISKWCWMEAIKRIGAVKSSAMSASYPFFTLLLAYFVLGEVPTGQQIFGFPFVIGGVLLILSCVPEKKEEKK